MPLDLSASWLQLFPPGDGIFMPLSSRSFSESSPPCCFTDSKFDLSVKCQTQLIQYLRIIIFITTYPHKKIHFSTMFGSCSLSSCSSGVPQSAQIPEELTHITMNKNGLSSHHRTNSSPKSVNEICKMLDIRCSDNNPLIWPIRQIPCPVRFLDKVTNLILIIMDTIPPLFQKQQFLCCPHVG